MNRVSLLGLIICIWACLLCSLPTHADDIELQLRKRGVRVSSNSAMLIAESELTLGIRDVTNLRRAIVSAEKRYDDFLKAKELLHRQITSLNQRSNLLNSQLANVRDVATNNRLVGAINTVDGQLRLAYQKLERLSEQEGDVHGAISKARDNYLTHILDLQKKADELQTQYNKVDRVTASLLSQFNKSENKSIQLQPTTVFAANLVKLERLQADILTSDLPLRRDGNTYYSGVVINDQDPVEMVVDSGASIVMLPYEDAVELDLKPGKNDQEIQMVVADGRVIRGYRMTIKKMRVGHFEAENVECAVLGPSAINAEPLLGMSFLSNFKFEINAGDSTLRLTDIDADRSRPRRRSPSPTPSSINVSRTIFPATDLEHVTELSLPRLEVNGQFKIDDGKLVSSAKETTAMLLTDPVDDFELVIDGELSDDGLLYFLLGWDVASKSGHIVKLDNRRDTGVCSHQYIEEGVCITPYLIHTRKMLGNGQFKLLMDQGHLVIQSGEELILDALKLEHYQPGSVIMGTKPGSTGGKAAKISRIELSGAAVAGHEFVLNKAPLVDDFQDLPADKLLPLKENGEPNVMPTVINQRSQMIQPNSLIDVTPEKLTSKSDKHSIIKLVDHADEFVLSMKGLFWKRGYMYWLVGWDEATSSGLMIEHEQLIRSGAFTVTEVISGEFHSRTFAAGYRWGRSEIGPTIMVKDDVLVIEVNNRPVVKEFLLPNYAPGSILMGTRPNRYKGKESIVTDIEFREID